MKIVILTQSRNGIASKSLPVLIKNNINVSKVVYVESFSPNKSKNYRRKLKKLLKIGVLGALNGVRIRKWFGLEERNIEELCRELKVDFSASDYMSSEKTYKLVSEADADLGLSLGNGYIPEKIFTVPRQGFVNIHTEILPDFQGAQSIIWPIYEGICDTGFTFHQVSKHIDKGDILYRKKYPIDFFPTLEKTVRANLEKVRQDIPDALVYLCNNYHELKSKSQPQTNGKSYTTPSFLSFLKMCLNNYRFFKKNKH